MDIDHFKERSRGFVPTPGWTGTRNSLSHRIAGELPGLCYGSGPEESSSEIAVLLSLWGAIYNIESVRGLWMKSQARLHISVSSLRLTRWHVLMWMDNTATVAYISFQGTSAQPRCTAQHSLGGSAAPALFACSSPPRCYELWRIPAVQRQSVSHRMETSPPKWCR